MSNDYDDRRAGLKIHFGIESDMMNAEEGDYEYKMDLKKPIDRYKHRFEETPKPHVRKIVGMKKIGRAARRRLLNKRTA